MTDMALYAIGDLHLAHAVDKPMDVFGDEWVIYSHLHGKAKYNNSIQGIHNGIIYRLVSSDYLDFKPEEILP